MKKNNTSIYDKQRRSLEVFLVILLCAGAVWGVPQKEGSMPAHGNGVMSEGVMLRDPFWPVGYYPSYMRPVVEDEVVPTPSEAEAAAIAAREAEIMRRAMAQLKTEGIVQRGKNYLATVNGMLVEEGDIIPIQVEDRIVFFSVRTIDMKKVVVEQIKR